MGVRFTVLGPVEVLDGGRPVTGLAPRHRAVLAFLLVNAGRVMSAERIIEAVWGFDPPETARSQVHAALTAIRRALRGTDAAGVIETRPAGYRIQPGNCDLDEFTRRVTTAQSSADPDAAAAELRTALALWTGEPLADVHAEYVRDARMRLEERRLAAFERLAERELERGRHEEVLDELAEQVAAAPLRERLTGHLVLALYRVGRQADALAAARAYRTLLADSQGLDPGRAFAALEEGVLRDDARLSAPVPVPVNAPPTPTPTPHAPDRQTNYLPPDIPDFAGRADELHRLLPTPDDAALPVVTIDGMAGIGKTALAVHAAHRVADQFPDGQLFVDLQAHTTGQAPVEPGAALEILLRQLGVPAARIPTSTHERSALWRAELADRRVVVVLDNAADAEQVRTLLPGGSSSLILTTSRRRLVDLDGARVLSMDLLPAGDAIGLFGAIVGERADAEPIAVLDVLQLCGFLPLAVRIAAARLHHRPRWTVAYLADRLRAERRRLAELATADRSVAAAFALSYHHLSTDQRRMFRMLGLVPGRDVRTQAAAELADIAHYAAEDLLEDLLDAHMLVQQEPGRYTFHDLLREHARTTAEAEESEEERQSALGRLRRHYLGRARVAVDLAFPYGIDQRPPIAMPWVPGDAPADEQEAIAWLDAERANLIAIATQAAHEVPEFTGLVASTLRPYLDGDAHHGDAVTLHSAALLAARQSDDRAARARAHTDLGWSLWRQGDYGAAEQHSSVAWELARDLGTGYEEARALNTLGNIAWRKRDVEQARTYFEQALTVVRRTNNRVGEAHILGSLSMTLDASGRYEEAHVHFDEALALHRKLGNQRGEALVLDKLGLFHRSRGDHEQASAHHGQAADLYRRLGNRSDEAAARNGLGEAALAAGDVDTALAEHGSALALARETGNRPEQARAHEGLARAQLGHDDAAARREAAEALACYTELGVPEAGDVRDLLAAWERTRG